MKKTLLLLTAAAVLTAASPCPALAQPARHDSFAEIREDPDKAATVFYMYDHDDIPTFHKAPRGYKPFYISHYGRHGARNHSSSGDYAKLMDMLQEGHDLGVLTEKGEDFYRRYKAVYGIFEGRGGDLTDLGADQQYKISANMYRNYRRIFRKGARIDARSTIVPRCILTMTAFCQGLKELEPSLVIDKYASEADMYYLNPFTINNLDVTPTDEGYNNKHAAWQQGFQEFCKSKLHPEAVIDPLFKDKGIVSKYGKPLDVELRIFSIAEGMQCNGLTDESFWDIIPIEETCLLWESINYRFYCSKGPDNMYQSGRQWAFVWTTMQNILDEAEKDMESGEFCARLRFGHDIIAMSLFAMLDIEGFNVAVTDYEDIKYWWRSFDFPMALNIQFVFYKDRKGDVLVRMMYNERDMALPIEDCGTPYYYRWEDFKSFCQARIDVAHNIIATTKAPEKRK